MRNRIADSRNVGYGLMRLQGAAMFVLLSAAIAVLLNPRDVACQAPVTPVAAFELLRAHLPKDELQVRDFIAQHPEADGSGALVAILDSGVDLDQAGLQYASGGLPKIIDFFDATDDGLVELPLEVTAENDSFLGISGRWLHLGKHREDAKSVRIGGLIIEEFFPQRVRDRLQEHADEANADALALLQGVEALCDRRHRDQWRKELAAHLPSVTWLDLVTIALPMTVFDDFVDSIAAGTPGSASQPNQRLLSGEDFTPQYFREAVLENGSGQHTFWGLLIDTDGDGDLGEERLLLDYRLRHDVTRLSDPAHVAVGANIAPQGDLVSLLYDEGGHGTHVSGIVSAFYGDDDPFNGIAPGAQILAIKIGNGKFGGATSHNSIMKGIDYALRAGAHVVNISFGGTSFVDGGRELVCDFINEAVDGSGIIVCSSAGNRGPALSTVGSPASARSVLAIGASLSPATMETNYGVVHPRRLDLFGFSSRGPLLGGELGVDFIAPGAAFSTLPSWHLAQAESWNGTSMASPQASGCIALLVSAALKDGVPYDAARTRRALRLSAKPLPYLLPIEQGAGLIQVLDAYDSLKDLASEQVVEFAVTGKGPYGEGGGYYTRNEIHVCPFRLSFKVKPHFPEHTPGETKASFQSTADMVSTVPWLSVARQIAISGHGATVRVTLDPTGLSEGLNTGSVLAFAAGDVRSQKPQSSRGSAAFEIPFTVIRPLTATDTGSAVEQQITLEPGDRFSTFVLVPEGATRARLSVRERQSQTVNAYSVALRYISVGDGKGSTDTNRSIRLARGDEEVMFMNVREGSVLEVATFSRWEQNGPGTLQWNLSFDGIRAEERHVELSFQHPVGALSLDAVLENTNVSFSARLDQREESMPFRWAVRPDTTYKTPPLGHPPLIAIGRGFVDVSEEADFIIQWGFHPEFDDFLDDAIWRLRTRSGRTIERGYVARGDAKVTVKEPGRYELQVEVFAPALQWVESSTGIVPRLFRKTKAIPVHVYTDVLGAHLSLEERRITERRLDRSWSWRFGLRPAELPEEHDPLYGNLEIKGHGVEGPDKSTTEALPLLIVPITIRSVARDDTVRQCLQTMRAFFERAERALAAGEYKEAGDAIAFVSRHIPENENQPDRDERQCLHGNDIMRLARIRLWHASRPRATEDELREAHSFVRDIVLAAEQKAEEKEAKGPMLIAESRSSPAMEADLWEARLFVRQAIAAIEQHDAGRARTFLRKARDTGKRLSEKPLEGKEERDLHQMLETEYAIAVWQLARGDRGSKHSAEIDSVFAGEAYDVVTRSREVLESLFRFYLPFTPWIEESLIRALTDLGWTDLATLELDRWMKHGPALRSKQYQLRREIATVHPSQCVLRWASLRSRE